jgi:translation initiation factor IF-1
MNSEKAIELEGMIISVLAGTKFRVQLANEQLVLAHISGKMRKRFIRLTTGDRVKLQMSPSDVDKARIVHRLGTPQSGRREAISSLRAVTASKLKNNFGEVIGQATKGPVAITRHQRAEFVLLPVEHYLELQQARTAPLDALTSQFDAMVARMNTPAAKQGVNRLFKASPAGLGKSAVKAAKVAHGG